MKSFNTTFWPTTNYQHRNWLILDCQGQSLGRLATLIATLLKGKRKPQYHPSLDLGDYVVLINADAIRINPESHYYRVSQPGRPGHSLTIQSARDCLPKFAIHQTVKGMLAPTEKKRLLKRLYIYPTQQHPHQAQQPIPVDLSMGSSSVSGTPR